LFIRFKERSDIFQTKKKLQDSMELNKLYYSIGEVAAMFGVSNSLLRYWETEFETIRPTKNKRGDRRYSEKDIEEISRVYVLVKNMGYTIEGAKNEIKGSRRITSDNSNDALREKLFEIRARLQDLESQL